MITRRAALATPLALAACGGGDDARPRLIALIGNSLASGYLQHQPGERERLDTPPARLLADLTGAAVIDYSSPGATARGLLEGAATLSLGPFERAIRNVPADTAVFWLGGVEAVTGLAGFQAALDRLVRASQRAGMRCVLVCTYLHPDYLGQVALVNASVRAVGQATGAAVVEVADLPAVRVDAMHLDDASSAATMRRVAQTIGATP